MSEKLVLNFERFRNYKKDASSVVTCKKLVKCPFNLRYVFSYGGWCLNFNFICDIHNRDLGTILNYHDTLSYLNDEER